MKNENTQGFNSRGITKHTHYNQRRESTNTTENTGQYKQGTNKEIQNRQMKLISNYRNKQGPNCYGQWL